MRSPYNPWNVAVLNPQIGGGGATTLAALTDVNLGTPAGIGVNRIYIESDH